MSSETIITEIPAENKAKGEVSAASIARMMGLATATDLSVLEGKMDLVLSRMSSVSLKVEKLNSALQTLPTAADIDRVDMQIGGLKSVIRQLLSELQGFTNKEGSRASSSLEKTAERIENVGKDGQE